MVCDCLGILATFRQEGAMSKKIVPLGMSFLDFARREYWRNGKNRYSYKCAKHGKVFQPTLIWRKPGSRSILGTQSLGVFLGQKRYIYHEETNNWADDGRLRANSI